MSAVANLHDLELIWPSPGPRDVIVTGSFDQWSASIHLAKGDTGFSGTVKVPWGQKIAYKYIVDGLWQCRDDLPREDDGHGNINNVVETPAKPAVPAVPSLFIPPDDTQWGQVYGDVETMVTAVEFLPPVDLTAIRGPLPLPIPQLIVEGLDQEPSVGTPVSQAKLDTAAATEGAVSPASETPDELAPVKQAPSSCDSSTLPVNDNASVSVPRNEDMHDFRTLAPVQFTKGESEAAEGTISAPLESTVRQPDPFPQAAQDVAGPTVQIPTPTSVALPEPPPKQPEVDLPRPVEQDHREQATAPAPVSHASTPTPASSSVTPKKRLSLLARIKHIFDKNSDKKGRKEKNK